MKNIIEANEIDVPKTNLMITGAGMDKNGNQIIKVNTPNERAVSIQTNQNLPLIHSLIKKEGKKDFLKKLSDKEFKELIDYVEEFATGKLKSKFKKFNKESFNCKPYNRLTIFEEENKKTDIKDIIKDFIETNWSKDKESAGKAVNLLKGLAFSDDPIAKKFIKDLDKASNTLKTEDYK